MITKKQFQKMNPMQKGYVVYMCGARKDEPNVPKNYAYKTERNQKLYKQGQAIAIQEVQDCP